MSAAFDALCDQVQRRLSESASATPVTVEDIQTILSGLPVVFPDDQWQTLPTRLFDHLVGAGPLGELLRDPEVTDVFVNSPSEVWLDRGTGLVPAGVVFNNEEQVRECARRLAASAGRPLESVPRESLILRSLKEEGRPALTTRPRHLFLEVGGPHWNESLKTKRG